MFTLSYKSQVDVWQTAVKNRLMDTVLPMLMVASVHFTDSHVGLFPLLRLGGKSAALQCSTQQEEGAVFSKPMEFKLEKWKSHLCLYVILFYESCLR